MDRFDMMADAVVTALRGYVERALLPFSKRLDAVESRQPEKGEPGKDGQRGEKGERGEKGDIGQVGKDGQIGPEGKAGAPGVSPPIEDIVARAVTVLRATEVPLDREALLENLRGESKALCQAETSRMEVELERRASEALQRVIDKFRQPKDGKDGLSGVPEDFDLALDERTLSIAMRCGERIVTKTIELPIPIYRGVLRSGAKAKKNDVVTFGGSQWIARRDTSTAPPGDDWQCCVQKGRDGKDGE